MEHVKKSVLLPYSCEQMYELVDRIEDYPKFLPWCSGATILETHPGGKTARLDIDYHGVRAHWTTDNANTPPERIVITLKDGPFKRLHGEWRFRRLSDDACKVELELAYEFASALLEAAVGPVFDRIASTFVEAFVKRADALHGET